MKFKDIEGFEERYGITECGKVISKETKRRKYSIILKQGFNRKGYAQVVLWKDGKGYARKVHRLVAVAYIKNTNNKECVNHKNGIKSDNNVVNLEWCTSMENTQHARENGLLLWSKERKEEFSKSKIGVSAYWNNKKINKIDLKTKAIVSTYNSIKEALLDTKVTGSAISNNLSGRYKSAGGYYWKLV